MKLKIEDKMKERDYTLWASSDNILYFVTPVDEKPSYCCDVKIEKDNNVSFKLRYVTKKGFELCSDWIGCFFDDNHFKKFEDNFWQLARFLYNYEENNQ